MYGENTNTIAIPIYRVLPYPVINQEIQFMIALYIVTENLAIVSISRSLHASVSFYIKVVKVVFLWSVLSF